MPLLPPPPPPLLVVVDEACVRASVRAEEYRQVINASWSRLVERTGFVRQEGSTSAQKSKGSRLDGEQQTKFWNGVGGRNPMGSLAASSARRHASGRSGIYAVGSMCEAGNVGRERCLDPFFFFTWMMRYISPRRRCQ